MNKSGLLLFVTALLLFLHQDAAAYNIVFILANVGSHFINSGHLAEQLVSKGHQVTMVVPETSKIPSDITKLNPTVIRFACPDDVGPSAPAVTKVLQEMAFNPGVKAQLGMLTLLGTSVMDEPGLKLLSDEQAMAKITAGKFDFAVVDAIIMSYLLVPYKLGIPYSVLLADCFGHMRRIPIMPSYMPHMLTSYTDQMTFLERVVNFVVTIASSKMQFSSADFSKHHIPELPATGLSDLYKNASLCLQLRDNMMDFTRPEMPDVIPITTIMGRPAQPLPTDLKKFMDESRQGVIIISFGSHVGTLPDTALDKLMIAFKALKQNVIFKYKSSISNVPNNVRIMNWIPQNDLLGHENLKLFITHCGMNSLIEAVYHGKPVLGFPFAIDQHSNGAIVRGKGLGETLALHDFTSQELIDTINKILSEPKYAANAKKISTIYQDVKKSGLRDPVYWIEHVLKYGAQHLRAHAYDMPDFQYFMVDVIAFLTAAILLLLGLIFFLLRCMCKRMCGRSVSKSKKE